MTTVHDAKRAAARWVSEVATALPGFSGAFLHGSINWMTDDSELPTTSDVDLFIVSQTPDLVDRPGKIRFEGVLLEVSIIDPNRLASAETVLSGHRFAGTFSRDCVLADSDDRLFGLQRAVSRDFSNRRWVQRRFDSARDTGLQFLRNDDPQVPVYDQVTMVTFGTSITSDMLMIAALRNPTVRRRFAVVRALLEAHGLTHVYESLLTLFGCADMTGERVEEHLLQMQSAFDAASRLDKPGYRFAADISTDARSVAIDGSRELIDKGHHRDAIFWIIATYCRCMNVFDLYGDRALFEHYSAGFEELIAELGIATYEARRQRAGLVEQEYLRIRDIAESLMDSNPSIV